jgi:hypothetical protein
LKIRTHSFGFDLVLLSTRFDSVLWLAIWTNRLGTSLRLYNLSFFQSKKKRSGTPPVVSDLPSSKKLLDLKHNETWSSLFFANKVPYISAHCDNLLNLFFQMEDL